MAPSGSTMPYSFDTNRSYCRRLAQVTLFQIEGERKGHGLHARPDLAAGACAAAPADPRRVMLDWQLTYFFDRSVDYFNRSVERLDPALESVEALAAKLESRPDVQSRLTPITGYTLSKWLLERELESCCAWTATPDGETGQMPDAYRAARRRNASGLCLSGGGIRSATFALGVAQGLSRLGVLGRLTYLSSVSGGGYMHQFLANWIRLTGSTAAVEDLLDPIPRGTGPTAQHASHPPGHGERASVQAEPLRWLRRYSNYLAPRKGLFTLDTLTIGATWLRNTGLNLLILLSFLYCVLLLPHLGTIPYAQFRNHPKLVYALVLVVGGYAGFLLGKLNSCMQGLRHETGPATASARAARPAPTSGWSRLRETLSRFDDGVKSLVGSLVRRGEEAAERGRRVPHMSAFVLASVSLLGFAVLVAPSVYRSVIPGGSVSAPEARGTFQPAPEPEVVHYRGDFERTTPDEESVKVTVDTVGAKPPSAFSRHWSSHPGPLLRQNLAGHGWPITFYGIYAAILLFFVFKQTAAKRWVWWVLFAVGLLTAYLFLEGVRLLFFVLCFAVPYDLIPAMAEAVLPLMLFTLPFVLLEEALGLLGHETNSSQREWLARWRALSLLVGGSWLVIILFSLFGPWVFHALGGYAKTSYSVWGAWLATTLAGVVSARNNRTSQTQESSGSRGSWVLELVAAVAPPLFVVGLLVLLSTFVDWSLRAARAPGPADLSQHLVHLGLLFGASLLLALVFGTRVDINDFSMHAFYRDRIARCYAGASDPRRSPNPFTGMARSDRTLAVHDLLPRGYRSLDPACNRVGTYAGPFPIFCTALNLTTGEDLAYQERKAASFAFTPLFSGYSVGFTAATTDENQLNGFVDTRTYVYHEEKPAAASEEASRPPADWDDRSNADADSISVATACAISGAAASPNMGYHSNAAAAFLLTVFNVRLGWWLRNPRRRRIGNKSPYAPAPVPPAALPAATAPDAGSFWHRQWRRMRPVRLGYMPSSPRVGFFSLFKELFGHSDDRTAYVYLTDGGHFDNMGLYELLRRRCRTVIVCDAEADANLHFEGIGMAIRKARVDFGVEVTLDSTQWPDPAAAKPAGRKDESSSTTKDPAHPGEAVERERHRPLPYVLEAHLSHTEPVKLTGTFSRQAPPVVIAGLSSFGEFPANSIHCVHGTIRYPEDEDESQFGKILYLKASLTGDEPPDILNYRMQHPAFPHDTTLNQFFTESQFESYRRLGEHIVLEDKVVRSWLQAYLGAPAGP